MTTLRGIAWNHTRGFKSIVATAQRFEELHPDVSIVWEMEVQRGDGPTMKTTRCPIPIDGVRFKTLLGGPRVGQHTEAITKEFEFK